MDEKRTVMYPIRFSPTEFKKLKQYAKKRGEPLSVIIRRAIRLYMSKPLNIEKRNINTTAILQKLETLEQIITAQEEKLTKISNSKNEITKYAEKAKEKQKIKQILLEKKPNSYSLFLRELGSLNFKFINEFPSSLDSAILELAREKKLFRKKDRLIWTTT